MSIKFTDRVLFEVRHQLIKVTELQCKGKGKGHPRTGHEGSDGE